MGRRRAPWCGPSSGSLSAGAGAWGARSVCEAAGGSPVQSVRTDQCLPSQLSLLLILLLLLVVVVVVLVVLLLLLLLLLRP